MQQQGLPRLPGSTFAIQTLDLRTFDLRKRIPFPFILFQTLLPLSKPYLLPFHQLPNSCRQTPRGGYPMLPYFITSLLPYFSIRGSRLLRRATRATEHGSRYTSSRPIAPHPAKCQNFPCCLLRNTRPYRPAAGTQFRPFRCLTGKRTLGAATPQRRSWSPAGSQSRNRTRKKAWVFRSPSERLARGCSRERPNCSKVRSPHRAGKAGSVRLG